jgi:hypothetical protein
MTPNGHSRPGKGLPVSSWYNVPKWEKYTYHMTKKLSHGQHVSMPNGRKIYQMAITQTNIFHSKALQNIPILGF